MCFCWPQHKINHKTNGLNAQRKLLIYIMCHSFLCQACQLKVKLHVYHIILLENGNWKVIGSRQNIVTYLNKFYSKKYRKKKNAFYKLVLFVSFYTQDLLKLRIYMSEYVKVLDHHSKPALKWDFSIILAYLSTLVLCHNYWHFINKY